MKTIYNYLIVLAAILMCSACNDEWSEELFKNTVSFGKNGVADIYIRYKPGGQTSYKVPIVVSGSTTNSRDYQVQVGLDVDTLNTLNFERFRYRDDLYFKLLDNQYYQLPSAPVVIPSGINTSTLDLNFSLGGLDMVEKYILPLTIKDDPSYAVNYRKHYRKSLLHIIPFNDYSGSYSASDGLVYERSIAESEQTPITMDTRQAFVVDEHSVFFYAGVTEEELEERGLYKIVATFHPGSTEGEGSLTIEAPHADKIKFRPISSSYTIRKEMDAQLPYLEHKYITLNMEYEYDQIVGGGVRLEYRFVGTLTMERKRNILIPDEDQQIIW